MMMTTIIDCFDFHFILTSIENVTEAFRSPALLKTSSECHLLRWHIENGMKSVYLLVVTSASKETNESMNIY